MMTPNTKIDDFKIIFEAMKLEFGSTYHNDMRAISKRVISTEIIKLETAIQTNDFEAIKKVAHKLIGSCTSLNLNQGIELSKKNEKAISEGKNTKENNIQLLTYLKSYIQFLEND